MKNNAVKQRLSAVPLTAVFALLALNTLAPAIPAADVAWAVNHLDANPFKCSGVASLDIHKAVAVDGGFLQGVQSLTWGFSEAGSTAHDQWVFIFGVGDQQTTKVIDDNFATNDGACGDKLDVNLGTGFLAHWDAMYAEAKHGTHGWECWWCSFSYHGSSATASVQLPTKFGGHGGVGGGDPGGY